jgi:hypothetical protein
MTLTGDKDRRGRKGKGPVQWGCRGQLSQRGSLPRERVNRTDYGGLPHHPLARQCTQRPLQIQRRPAKKDPGQEAAGASSG